MLALDDKDKKVFGKYILMKSISVLDGTETIGKYDPDFKITQKTATNTTLKGRKL